MSEFIKRRGGTPRREPEIIASVKALNPEKFARVEIDPDPELPAPDDAADDDAWERYFTHLEAAAHLREMFGAAVKHVPWTAPDDGKPVAVAFVGDIHAGANIDYLRFRRVLDAIAATDGLYAVCMGDLLENSKALMKSGNALYTSVFASPKEQLEYIKRRFNICRGKWLAILQGNHDAWDYRTAGIDRLPALCDWLGAPYMTEAGGMISATVGEQVYSIAVKHTWRGRSQINKTNEQRRMYDEFPSRINADVLCTAHLHEPLCHQEKRKGQDVIYLRTGTFKDRGDEWAESNGYTPAFGVPVVILFPRERKVFPVPGPFFDDAVMLLRSLRRETS